MEWRRTYLEAGPWCWSILLVVQFCSQVIKICKVYRHKSERTATRYVVPIWCRCLVKIYHFSYEVHCATSVLEQTSISQQSIQHLRSAPNMTLWDCFKPLFLRSIGARKSKLVINCSGYCSPCALLLSVFEHQFVAVKPYAQVVSTVKSPIQHVGKAGDSHMHSTLHQWALEESPDTKAKTFPEDAGARRMRPGAYVGQYYYDERTAFGSEGRNVSCAS